jgi:hypothetical protein
MLPCSAMHTSATQSCTLHQPPTPEQFPLFPHRLRHAQTSKLPHLHHRIQTTHITPHSTFVLLAVSHRAFRMISWTSCRTHVKPASTAFLWHLLPVLRLPRSERSFNIPATALLCGAAEASTAASSVDCRTPPNQTLPGFLARGPCLPPKTPAVTTS